MNDYTETDRWDAHPSVLPSEQPEERFCPQCGGDHDAMDPRWHPSRANLLTIARRLGLVGGMGSDE